MDKQRIVNAMPTAPDVQRLIDTFGVPAEGDIITWQAIEEVIKCRRRSNRFGTVVAAWRNKLEAEHARWLRTERGVGLVGANPSERIAEATGWTRQGTRKIARAGALAAATPAHRLTAEEQRVRTHYLLAAPVVQAALVPQPKESMEDIMRLLTGGEKQPRTRK